MQSNLPYSTLSNITFVAANDKTIEAISTVTVIDKNATRGTSLVPQAGGVCDLHMGTVDHANICATCGAIAHKCLGHPGCIPSNYPVYAPLFVDQCLHWLKVLCHTCGKLMRAPNMKDEPMRYLQKWALLLRQYYSSTNGTKAPLKCSCGYEYRPVEMSKNGNIVIQYTGKGSAHRFATEEPFKRIIWAHQTQAIFAKVDPRLVKDLDHPITSHPANFIWTKIPVSTNIIRPELRKQSGEVTSRNDITAFLSAIVECNDKITRGTPYDQLILSDDSRDAIQRLQDLVYGMIVKQPNPSMHLNGQDKMHMSLMGRQKGKRGRIRGNLMGRRAKHCARSFITCNTNLAYDEVGVPLSVAITQYREETVTTLNYQQCLIYVYNTEYPRARHIVRGDLVYEVDRMKRNANTSNILQIGDIVRRDIIDGDTVILNRQPSLEPNSLSCMRVRVSRPENTPRGAVINTFQFNVGACYLFNADFDGDAMNIYFPRNQRSAHEISVLCSPMTFFISQKNGLNKLGEDQDALVGLASISAEKTKYDRVHALRLFADMPFIPALYRAAVPIKGAKDAGELYHGRDVITSGLLARGFNINYVGTPSVCDEIYATYRDYAPEDRKVIIRNGVLLGGIIDAASVGRDKPGGILHQIYDMVGPTNALRACEMLQAIALQHLYRQGLTMAIGDMLIASANRANLRKIEAVTLANSAKIDEQLRRGKIIAPVGRSITDYYEELQLNALERGSKYIPDVMQGMNIDGNGFYDMISTGARGKLTNIFAVNCNIGQTKIGGMRPVESLGGRCLPFFTRYGGAETRGYISSNYLLGLNAAEWMAHSVEARVQLFDKSLSTAVVGDQNRRSIKNLENLLVDNLRRLCNNGNLIELLYGGDGMNAKYLKIAEIPTCDKGLDAAAFDEKFKYGGKGLSKADAAAILVEYAQLLADRAEFASLVCANIVSDTQTNYSHKVSIPVDVSKIMHDVVAIAGDVQPSFDKIKTAGFDIERAVAKVQKLCLRLPYCLYNRLYMKSGRAVSVAAEASVRLTRMHLRAYLCCANLMRQGVNMAMLKQIITGVWIKYQMALVDYGRSMGIVAAQSISEPMTQMVLNSAHRVGSQGGGGVGMKRVKEILTASRTHEMKQDKYVGQMPVMYINVIAAYRHDEVKVKELAAQMEMLTLRRFVRRRDIIWESYGEPVHPDYAGEHKMFAEFDKYHGGARPQPGDLTNYCIRVELSKDELFQKQMHHNNEIAVVLQKAFRDQIYIVYTSNLAEKYIMRMYIRANKTSWTSAKVRELSEEILDYTVRGIKGIISTRVFKRKLITSDVTTAATFTPITDNEVYYIMTDGTNLAEIIKLSYVDPQTTYTNALKEMEAMYGISVVRNRLITEIGQQVKGVSYRHRVVYVEEMTFTGVYTAIDRHGSQKRNKSFMLHISDARPQKIITDAALYGRRDTLDNVSSAIIVGKSPKLGNRFNTFLMDSAFVRERLGNVDKIIADL